MIKFIRWLIGQILIVLNAIFSPKGLKRSAAEQAKMDTMTSKMALYQFAGCPFCIKVRRAIKRRSLNIELRDAINDKSHEADLTHMGGKRKVPCLRITSDSGTDQWMYESNIIINYLQQLG